MQLTWRALVYGFLVWLVPFVVAVSVFPIRSSSRALFESIMAVVVTLAVVVFAGLYFRRVEASYRKEGMLIGLLWLAMSIGIDLPLFSSGPMKMPLSSYMADIGVTYLIIPIVTIGFGLVLQAKG